MAAGGGGEDQSANTSASATPSALSAPRAAGGGGLGLAERGGGGAGGGGGGGKLSRAQRLVQALKGVIGEYEWGAMEDKSQAGKKSRANMGEGRARHGDHAVVIISPCPSDGGAGIDEFLSVKSEGDETRVKPDFETQTLCASLDSALQRREMQGALEQRRISLQWIDSGPVLSALHRGALSRDVGKIASAHVRKVVACWGGGVVPMQHMIYGSSAIAFSQRYEAAIARSGSKIHASSKPVLPLSPAFSHLACRHASNLAIASKIRFLRLHAEISLSLIFVWCNTTLSMNMGTAIGLWVRCNTVFTES